MISLFSRMMDYAIESHFGKDPSGRLVFIPFGLKGKCYFVDSKSEEEKIRAFVKMYRSAFQLISWLTFPSIYVPALILDDFGGLSPRGHRLAIALGIPLFFWLVLVALMLMLWGLYQQAVPGFTASLSEVGPESKWQLRRTSSPNRRMLLFGLCILAGIALLTVGFLVAIIRK